MRNLCRIQHVFALAGIWYAWPSNRASNWRTLAVNSINRAAVVVRPKAPFFDWARSLEGGLPEATEAWTSVYLVEAGEDEEPSVVLRRCFASIFEEQLVAWHRDMEDWPKPRTMATFRDWFEANVVDLVFDLCDGPIEHDD